MDAFDKIGLYAAGNPALNKKYNARHKRKEKSGIKRKIKKLMRERQQDLIDRKTPAEKAFLKIIQTLGFSYEFQKICKANKKYYIVDFYLTDYHIVCEIDGDHHQTQYKKDAERTQNLLQNPNISKIVRFSNNQALRGNIGEILYGLFPETNNRSLSRKALNDTEATQTRSNLVYVDKRTG